MDLVKKSLSLFVCNFIFFNSLHVLASNETPPAKALAVILALKEEWPSLLPPAVIATHLLPEIINITDDDDPRNHTDYERLYILMNFIADERYKEYRTSLVDYLYSKPTLALQNPVQYAQKNCPSVLPYLYAKDNEVRSNLEKAIDINDNEKIEELLQLPTPLRELHTHALMYGCQVGNYTVVQKMLDEGIPVESRNKKGLTPLMAAISYKEGEKYPDEKAIISLLLQKGANPNSTTSDNATALIFASFVGKIDIVKELLHYGASAKIKNNAGKTALLYAKLLDRQDIIQLLEKHLASF